MKKRILYIVMMMLSPVMMANEWVRADQYQKMYNHIEETLDIHNNVYVSDTTRSADEACFSAILRDNYNTIEGNLGSLPSCSHLIYFSNIHESIVKADVFLCVKKLARKEIFPCWWNYDKLYSFVFQIKEEEIICLQHTQMYEL